MTRNYLSIVASSSFSLTNQTRELSELDDKVDYNHKFGDFGEERKLSKIENFRGALIS